MPFVDDFADAFVDDFADAFVDDFVHVLRDGLADVFIDSLVHALRGIDCNITSQWDSTMEFDQKLRQSCAGHDCGYSAAAPDSTIEFDQITSVHPH